MMANTPLFKTEGRMYTEVLPIMQELLKNIKDPEIIAPNLIHYNAKPAILIFQDIAPDDFVMQHMPVPLEKTALVAQKLGKFHALSFYMNEERGESKVVQSFNEGMFGDHGGIGQEWDFVGPSHKVLCESVRSWGMETLADKLVLLQPHVMEKLNKVFSETSKSAGIKVLNHGDFHIRNLLFRYDDPTTKANFEAIRFVSEFESPNYGLIRMASRVLCRSTSRLVSTAPRPLTCRICWAWLQMLSAENCTGTGCSSCTMMNLRTRWTTWVFLGKFLLSLTSRLSYWGMDSWVGNVTLIVWIPRLTSIYQFQSILWHAISCHCTTWTSRNLGISIWPTRKQCWTSLEGLSSSPSTRPF